jgi:adenylate cyclase
VSNHTFLFADLVGFTALTDAEGDDRAADVALRLYGTARELLGRYSAEELKTLGDGIVMRCDEPAGGIELALELVEALESIPGFPAVRIGVHSGPAVSRAGDWYGRTVNVAARLCTAAGGGEVLVSENARAAVDGRCPVEFGERRMHWLRNVTEPIAAYVAASAPEPRAVPARRFTLRRPCSILSARGGAAHAQAGR